MPAAVVDGNPKTCLSSTPSTSMTTSGERQRGACGGRQAIPQARAAWAIRNSRAST